MPDIEHMTVNGDTYDISDAVARENADMALSTASDSAIAAANAQTSANNAQSTADQVKSQINNFTFSINSDDQGLDITIN